MIYGLLSFSHQIKASRRCWKNLRILLMAAYCTMPAFAQVQGNRPDVIDAAIDGSSVNTNGHIAWPENVAINDTLVCGILVQNDGTTSVSIADTLANTWTRTTPTVTPGVNGPVNISLAYTKSTSAGADSIALTVLAGTGNFALQCARFSNLGAVDGSVATATSGVPTGVGTINTSITTTVNEDLLVNYSAGAEFGSHADYPDNTEFLSTISSAGSNYQPTMSQMHTTAFGTYTPTHYIWGGSSTRAMQTLAFKPALGSATSSILITDTVMPDGGNGVAYSAQLHCAGGTAAQTFSLFAGSLPTGLSLNTSTGAITGTPTVNGSYSPQFKCTDGTLTSAAQTLPITIGATLGVPNVRQINNTWSGDNGGGSFTMDIQCGSTIVVFLRGDDTHGSEGWVQATSGVNNYVKDSLGSTVRRLSPIGGVSPWPYAVYAIGPVAQSGADTVSAANNQGASSSRTVGLAAEITGANAVDNVASSILISLSASGSQSTSYTSVVTNTMLLVGGDADNTLSLGAPFSVISSGGDVEGATIYGSAVISSPATTTATLSFSGASTSNPSGYNPVVVPLRPMLPLAGCPANFGTGEKIRRQVF